MRSKSGTHAIGGGLLDPARWLLSASMQQTAAESATAIPANLAPGFTRPFASGELSVECLDWEQAARRIGDWRRLVDSSVERNVFLEPAFALSAAQHFPAAERPLFLFITAGGWQNEQASLVGVFAFQKPNRTTSSHVRLWCAPQMALGGPLVSNEQAFPVLDLVQDWFAAEFTFVRGILVPAIPANGPLAILLRDHARARALLTQKFDSRSRAFLVKDAGVAERIKEWIGSKRSKEFRRLMRRLSERGDLQHVALKSGAELRQGAEDFMALEASGWKGQRGTALLCDPSLATFMRTMARRFAASDQFEIDGLTMNGKPIAMSIVLKSGPDAYFWKTAYDENFAQYSPGVLLALKFTARMLENPQIASMNSCALPNHPMIDHIWPDRIEMIDLLVSLKGHGQLPFMATASTESVRRRMRTFAKSAYYKMIGEIPT
ncbi:MAG: GNAT family N-acetyltransferase [Beijerinckiaceae bacterium]